MANFSVRNIFLPSFLRNVKSSESHQYFICVTTFQKFNQVAAVQAVSGWVQSILNAMAHIVLDQYHQTTQCHHALHIPEPHLECLSGKRDCVGEVISVGGFMIFDIQYSEGLKKR